MPPLSIHLVSLDIPPRTADGGQLILQTGDLESTTPVSVGRTAAISGTSYDVMAVRPWAGLLHRPPGMPMLNVAVKPPGGDWIENVFVPLGAAHILTQEIVVVVGRGSGRTLVSPARWGIVEDDRTHWFSSFVPGTGVELANGDVVTLLMHQPSGRILVEIDAQGSKSEIWVDANRHQPGGQIRYEDPRFVAYRIEIEVDENGPATVSIVEGDLERWSRPVEIGLILVDEESGLSVRIDQHEREALALFAAESPWFEVVLSAAGHVLRIREGEAVRMGETTVSFEAFGNPQPARALITIGGTDVPFVADTVHEVDGWRFDGMRALSPSEIALAAARTGRRLPLRVGLTMLLIVAGMVYLLAARRGARISN